jgi:cell division protein FtsA
MARDGMKALNPRQPLTAAVDLGDSKVACFIMKAEGVRRADRTLSPAGVGYVQSRGVRGGAIIDTEEAVEAIAQAVERAEAVAGQEVQAVTVATSGGQLACRRVFAEAPLGARPIAEQDCSRAIALAVAQARASGRRPIHLLPITWSVDGQPGVRDPRSMFGRALGLHLLVVSISESAYQTLAYCIERAHLQLEGVVAAPFVSALACVEDEEMKLGCVCIDMGGSLVHVDSLPIGGGHVTADIARVLSTSIVGAERIKTLYGSAVASASEDRQTIEVPPRSGDSASGPGTAPRSLLTDVIAQRVEETLDLLGERLRSSGAPLERGAGVILTGGASELSGVRELAMQVFERPVRLGRPRRVPHLADVASGPAFCTAAGVLQRAAFGPREADTGRRLGPPRRAGDLDAGPIGRLAGWLRDKL